MNRETLTEKIAAVLWQHDGHPVEFASAHEYLKDMYRDSAGAVVEWLDSEVMAVEE